MHKQLKVLAIKNFSVFSGEQSLEMAVETVKQQSRRYAKRQLTWFRNEWLRRRDLSHNRFAQVEEVAEWLQQKRRVSRDDPHEKVILVGVETEKNYQAFSHQWRNCWNLTETFNEEGCLF